MSPPSSLATWICCIILQLSNKKFAHSLEGNNIPTQPRRSVSRDSLLYFRLQPATGSASTSLASPACRMDSAGALRPASPAAVESPIAFSWCPTPTTAAQCFRPPKASRSRWGSKQNLPNSKLNCTDSRPWARWYRLRGLPLAGSECVCPQCNSYFVITREVPNNRRSAFPSISQELTRNANRESGTPVTGNSPTVKCPMVRSQRYSC